MRQYLAAVVPAFLVGGCSLIYNPSNIKPVIDATDAKVVDVFMQADARIDAAPVRDADPAMLTIDQVVPGVIYEGAGEVNSRNALDRRARPSHDADGDRADHGRRERLGRQPANLRRR